MLASGSSTLRRGALLGAFLSLAAAPGRVHAADQIRSPFVPIETRAAGVLVVAVPSGAHAALRHVFDRGADLELTEFWLPGVGPVELSLRPIQALEAGAGAVAMTPSGQRRVLPSVATFAGSVRGRASTAFLGISPDMVHGYVVLDGELYFLSSGPHAQPSQAMVAHAAALPDSGTAAAPWCEALLRTTPDDLLRDRSPTEHLSGGPVVRFADTFIEASPEYVDLFDGAPDPVQAATDYAALLLTASSEIFRRDVGAVITIPDGWLRVWTTTPPWGDTSIYDVRDWWDSNANPDRDLPRVSVHILDSPVSGGLAWLEVLCDHSFGYAYSSVYGFFPYPIEHTSNDNWDLLVVSHEFGHNWGSPHSFDYNPPIECEDGSGPDKGTLMNYCHLNPGGVENVGMRFHAREQVVIRAHADASTCVTKVPIALGDYDYDGTRDAGDLAVLDGVLVQGFFSAGCLETFDMNGDGVLDACDREVLAAIVSGAPPASTRVYGTGWPGTNGVPALTGTAPVIGADVTVDLDNSLGAATIALLLVGFAEASITTPLDGTILVAFTTTFQLALPADGTLIAAPIPCDADLGGLSIFVQALESDPGASRGVSFTRGLELVVGT